MPQTAIAAVHALVLDVLEPVRLRWGGPIQVVSGWRSEAWNTRVGGAKASTHMTGEGADIRPVRPSELGGFIDMIEDMVREQVLPKLGGIGVYRGWAHLDTRKAADGHLRRWRGKGVGSEVT